MSSTAETSHKQAAESTSPPSPSNRFGWDYRELEGELGRPPVRLTDVHSHINGADAVRIFKDAADLYGVDLIYSMTHLEQVDQVREILADRIRFIAVPDFMAEDKQHALGRGFHRRIEQFRENGARICKFWAAPRARDYAQEFGVPDFMNLDADHRVEGMQIAQDLGMAIMVHVADPDTWFAGKYADASFYGTKRDQYIAFEKLMDRFPGPWIAAHMGGWPENLEFLSGLLDRHDNLVLDSSACKWMVRELSRHSRDELIDFLTRYSGRVLFGSDIVTTDEHLKPADEEHAMYAKANTPQEAFDLYASRYWALRTLFEGDYDGESPIADPDLAMLNPEDYDEMSAPFLSGKSLPKEILRVLYHDAAANLLDPLFED